LIHAKPPRRKQLVSDPREGGRAAMKSIQRIGSQGAIFLPDVIMMADKAEGHAQKSARVRRMGPVGRWLPCWDHGF
jgi:hypothetical protein